MDSNGPTSLYVDLLRKLLDQSEDVSKIIDRMDRKMDLHIQRTEYEFEKIKELDETQNRILDEHVAGVNTLKAMLEVYKSEANQRLDSLEQPRKTLATLKTWIISAAAVVAAIMTILQLLGK